MCWAELGPCWRVSVNTEVPCALSFHGKSMNPGQGTEATWSMRQDSTYEACEPGENHAVTWQARAAGPKSSFTLDTAVIPIGTVTAGNIAGRLR